MGVINVIDTNNKTHVLEGVSNGPMEQTLVKGQAATRMTGRVSLDNNGGFIQIEAYLPPPPPSAKGVALHLIGNAETYNIHLRTSDLDRPWQSYRQAFTAPAEWTLCHFEFGDFQAIAQTSHCDRETFGASASLRLVANSMPMRRYLRSAITRSG